MKRTLGTCYYPEHWPEEMWAEDARRMSEAGLTWVRIGEFAWSRIEPEPGRFEWEWLDQAIDVLGEAGLKIVLGTPTATPPKWVVDAHPGMLARDAEGRERIFGSRRHYCFSHEGYLGECRRIVTALVARYGRNPHIAAWQTDNEYGCHDTTLSYSEGARDAFRDWLSARYQSTDALNRAWGNVFWSMEYGSFDEIELPNGTVTEPNPSHVLAFRRFSSDQVVRFNRVQAEIIRTGSDAPILHNYMGRVLEFDHFAVGDDLDIASWDSYPMGFLLDRIEGSEAEKQAYLRQGHPDFQAFHHDLYRSVGRGRWWVMEQQPGPVNWAPWNPAPLPGMVRLWSWEAFAHGAEAVCYFRWRQAPFGQEQHHAGLLRPDSEEAPGLTEAREVAKEIAALPDIDLAPAPVALVFDYASAWAWAVQPQGMDFDYFRLVFSAYRALRRAGLSVDILPPDASDLSAYKLVMIPGMMAIGAPLMSALSTVDGQVIVGPRSNAKTPELTIPVPLPPELSGVPAQVTEVESLPPWDALPTAGGGSIRHWFERLDGDAPVQIATKDDRPVLVGEEPVRYLAGWPDDVLWDRIVSEAADDVGLEIETLPEGLRIRDTLGHRFAFNYGGSSVIYRETHIPAAGVAWWPR